MEFSLFGRQIFSVTTSSKKKRRPAAKSSLLADAIRPVTAPLVKPYAVGGLMLFLLLVAIPAGVLLQLNAIGMFWMVGLLTIILAFFVWFVGLGPLGFTSAGLAGGIWSVLQKKAFGEGAAKGIEILIKALVLATFVFVMEGTMATFVWFGANRTAYIGLMVIGVASVLLGLQFRIKAGLMAWVLGGLLTLFAILSIFGIRLAIPAEKTHQTTEVSSLLPKGDGSPGTSSKTAEASDCPASEPCIAYDSIEVQLGPNEPLVINQKQFWSMGISVRPADPKIRATKPISSLYYLRQASDSNIVRIVPIATGFENDQPIKLVIYKKDGNADKRVAAEYGTYTPPIDITS